MLLIEERPKTLSELKSVQNISKNLQSFLEFSFLYINCKTMHMSCRILSELKKITPHSVIQVRSHRARIS